MQAQCEADRVAAIPAICVRSSITHGPQCVQIGQLVERLVADVARGEPRCQPRPEARRTVRLAHSSRSADAMLILVARNAGNQHERMAADASTPTTKA